MKNIKYLIFSSNIDSLVNGTVFKGGNINKQHKITHYLYMLALLMSTCSVLGCKKLVELSAPVTGISSNSVFENDATAIGVLTGLYYQLSSAYVTGGGELNNLSCAAGLLSDEFTLFVSDNETLSALYQNSLNNSNTGGVDFWTTSYQRIFVVNSALEGLSNATNLTPAVRLQLLGEAKFMRAFYYFHLTNLYGDVPLVVSTDYKVNALIHRSSVEAVYKQIILDLEEAQSLLKDSYIKNDGITPYPLGLEDRVRPNKSTVNALLARVYLYKKDWYNAERLATTIIANNSQYKIESINNVFLKNSKEIIWALQPVSVGLYTQDAYSFIITSLGFGPNWPVYISKELMNSFDPGDQRKSNWLNNIVVNNVDYFFPYKYKNNNRGTTATEYSIVFRLAELFLIRAEARIQQNKISEGINDLNILRDRATDDVNGTERLSTLPTSLSQEDALKAVLRERRVELFSEWGHRWFDLKRTGKIDEVMTIVTPKKGNNGGWKSYQQLYPIRSFELARNPNLVQNSGY